MNIYIGNLPYSISEDELRDLFAAHGEVSSANIIMDRDSGRSKGFGFIEMPDKAQGEAAINAINQTDVQGRSVRVNEARPRNDNRGGGGRR
ncbi:MAG: RNA-binding protein [Gammaproteobacteria bacterium]|nr:RNA-binding protein [Gammaproteobacteria bacterium]NNC68561.1 RNA-binding protein [Gammaproteobacteria bacterium]